ncbi:MAG: hypothetical protein K0Q73_8719 [Paenibacillus sp.]|jgi:RNA polymerase sigma factor (sigma-70 family)|nr:hypothetical protein [Paenibacillus sp.]
MENAKLVLINGSTPELKTFEDIHRQFQGLIRKKAYSWSSSYEFDELCQVAAIALWKAFLKYDVDAYPIPFIAIASKYIDYALIGHHNKYKPKFNKKTSQIRSMCSINDLISDGDGETELQDLIGEEETYTQETVDKIVLDKLLKRIPKQQKQDIFAYIDGYKMKELAEAKDTSSQLVATRIRSAFMRFRALYIKELVQ